MFKKSIYAITVLTLFTACSQKDLSVNSYDLASHWFNVKSLNDNKVVLNKNFTEQYNDGHKTSSYVDFNVYKKNKTDLNQIEKYSFFEDINKENYKLMISNKSVDLKYNIFANEIKENFEIDAKQISSYKRNIKINVGIIDETIVGENFNSLLFSLFYHITQHLTVIGNNNQNVDAAINHIFDLRHLRFFVAIG